MITPSPASYDQLTVFHDSEYVDFLKRITDVEDEEKYDEEAQQFGLSMFQPFSIRAYCNDPEFSDRQVRANSLDPDQTE